MYKKMNRVGIMDSSKIQKFQAKCLFKIGVAILAVLASTHSNISAAERNTSKLPPALSSYIPQPCIDQEKYFTIQGQSFPEHKLSADGAAFELVLENDGVKTIIKTSFWSVNKIVALLPKNVRFNQVVNIGIRTQKGWHSKLLQLEICQVEEHEPDQETSPELDQRRNNQTVTPIRNDPQDASSVNQSRQQSQPDKSTRSIQTRRLDNISSSGSLIGTPLPSLPEELKFVTKLKDQNHVADQLLVMSANMTEAKQFAQLMNNFQARVIRRKKMDALGMVLSTFRLPANSQVSKIITAIQKQQPDAWIDANSFYYPNTVSIKNRQQVFKSIGLRYVDSKKAVLKNTIKCGKNIRIGILDGPIDTSLPSLTNQSISVKNLLPRGKKAGSSIHATAIASLLVGDKKMPELLGIVSGASLFVGVVMQASSDQDTKSFTTTESLILGIDWLIKQKVQVINLSLGGSRNALLELALTRTLAQDIGVVAAAGNGGIKAPKSYPTAQTGIIAVNAIDVDGVIATNANQGDYIDLVAPGVDVWVASKEGGRYISGSSIAAPLVAAALAQLGGSPKQADTLFKSAVDKGAKGKDLLYGWGILYFPSCGSQ